MPDKARLPWKQDKVTFCSCILLGLSYLTYKLSKQLVSLYFDHLSCYQRVNFPPHLQVTWVQGTNLVSNPPVGKLISSLWFPLLNVWLVSQNLS